jgi:serine phosphatase RsbU (regulator of sigma subunit)/anti-sigma regulatory factor (Ser/Thr protein kinase)
MPSLAQRVRQWFAGPSKDTADQAATQPVARDMPPAPDYRVNIAPDDPLIAFFERSPDPILVEKLPLDTPGVRSLRAAGVTLVVPLVSQGELVGMLNLGPRMGEQQYSVDDRSLLNNLATQAAPAVRVAQLARRQELEAQARERIEQELRVARLIQETLLPKEVPVLPGWNIAALWRPAREVGGDFYDFIRLSDGRMVIIIGDVTDKGVPAAMVMATTRTMLRSAAMDTDSPGLVLQIVNERLCREIPPKMFVTCLYAILDPDTGRLSFANAGHDLPYRGKDGAVGELRATGMPLGLLPGMLYEEKETVIEAGERVLFYSDGLVEAHDPQRHMFGFPRLKQLVGEHPQDQHLIDFLMNELARFTGAGWEQEDDVTIVALERSHAPSPPPPLPIANLMPEAVRQSDEWRRLARFELPSVAGNEREAMRRVMQAVESLALPRTIAERMQTAVAETVMNAIEHGNMGQPELPVEVEVFASPQKLLVCIADQGVKKVIPPAQTPNLDAKLRGEQSPRGWGLFLIEKMADTVRTHTDESHHTTELEFNLE